MITSISRASAVALIALSAIPARAAAPTKEECVEAHAKGQDARDAGQIGRAQKLFLTCAQSACPDLVRADCARFADELDRLQPTITFAARDGGQRDLPDTAVYVDGALVSRSLGDGKAYDVDPGRHEVRFVHGTDEAVVTVVVAQGEKGRAVVGTFAAPEAKSSASPVAPVAPAAPAPEMKRPGGPLALVTLGALAAAAGGALLGVGFARMPSNCTLASHTCTASPGDPVFDRASTSVTLINVGAITGGAGVVALGGSLLWYFSQPREPAKTAITPWIGPQIAGIAISGQL